MAHWDQESYETSDDCYYLSPDHASSRRPHSTRRPRSRDSREPAGARRHSLNRNYHSDNEESHQVHPRYAQQDVVNMYTPSVPIRPDPYVPIQMKETGEFPLLHQPYEPTTHMKKTEEFPLLHQSYDDVQRERNPSPGRAHRRSDPWPQQSLVPRLYPPRPDEDPLPSLYKSNSTRRPRYHSSKQVPSPPGINRRSPSPAQRRKPISLDKRVPSPPRLRRRSPSPPQGRTLLYPKQVPSPPPLNRRRSLSKGAQSTYPEDDPQHFTAGNMPPGMKSYRKDRSASVEKSMPVPGGFPSTSDTVQPDESRSEIFHTHHERRPWHKRAVSEILSNSTSRPSSTVSSSGVLGFKAYQYRPLGTMEFRLVRILPARMSTIKCEIVHCSLKDPPPYTAISYAWGDADDRRKILLEGTSIPVNASLHGALEALREKKDVVLAWVDYLCIDQQNRDERTQQVQLMTRIYTESESVAVWLGPEANDSNLAIKVLEEMAASNSSEEHIRYLISSHVGKPDFPAVVSLFERDYWKRLWVVQEVFNAREIMVYCGSLQLPWRIYRTASQIFWRHRSDLEHYFGSSSRHHGQRASSNQFTPSQVLVYQGPSSLPDVGSLTGLGEESLLEVLRLCRSKLSADPRDKVFGILGVLSEDIRSEFPVDYSLSVKEVYINVVDYLLSTTERLDVIRESIHFPLHSSSASLPSWVPDWSHSPQTTALGHKFAASGKTKVDYRLLDERRKLEISAIYISTINVHGIAVGTLTTLADYLMAFLHWRALLLGVSDNDEKTDMVRMQDVFCRTLCFDQVPSGFGESQSWLTACHHVFASLINERLPCMPLDRELRRYIDIEVNGIEPETRRRFLQEYFGAKMMGRCFCLTEDGQMCMGSGFMAVGDVVVIPLGSSTPIILRPEGPRGEYRYVGDVYIHGYMSGKAVRQLREGNRTLQKFVLH